jgi:hypothetical protein
MAGMIEPRRFDRDHQFPRYHVSWDAKRNLDHSPSWFQADFAIQGKWLRQPPTVFRQSQHHHVHNADRGAVRRVGLAGDALLSSLEFVDQQSLVLIRQDLYPVPVMIVGAFALDISNLRERVEFTCRDLVQLLLGQFVGDFGDLHFRHPLHRILP